MNQNDTWQWPAEFRAVNWAGMGVESTKSWAKLIEADTGMHAYVAPEFDTVNRFRWLKSRLFESTAGNNSETSQMLMADRKYAVRDGGPFPVRAVWSHSKNNAGFFTRGDSLIKTPRDIKPGTRMVHMTYVASWRIIEGLLAWAGVSREEIDWVDANTSIENYQLVLDGHADVGFSFPNSPTMRQAEKNPHGLGWIDLNAEADPEGAKRFQEVDPLIRFGVIPDAGVASAAGIWGTEGIILELTHAENDPELIYRIAKWLDQNYARYHDLHPDNRFKTREILIEGLKHTFVPCHEGLIRYLKELDLWTPAHEKRQAENVELIQRHVTEYDRAIRLADEAEINVDPQNEKWQQFWLEHKRAQGITPVRLHDDL